MARTESTYEPTFDNLEVWNEKGKLQAGDKIEGYYVKHDEFDSKFGKFNTYQIMTDPATETKIKILGQSNIKHKMENIELGCYVWIEYLGLEETDRGARKTYKVDYDPELKIEVK